MEGDNTSPMTSVRRSLNFNANLFLHFLDPNPTTLGSGSHVGLYLSEICSLPIIGLLENMDKCWTIELMVEIADSSTVMKPRENPALCSKIIYLHF